MPETSHFPKDAKSWEVRRSMLTPASEITSASGCNAGSGDQRFHERGSCPAPGRKSGFGTRFGDSARTGVHSKTRVEARVETHTHTLRFCKKGFIEVVLNAKPAV